MKFNSSFCINLSRLPVAAHGLVLALVFFLPGVMVSAQEPARLDFHFEHANLNARVWQPQGEPVDTMIALPGSGGDYQRYKRIGPRLAEAGYKVVAMNQRGIAGSTGKLEDLTLSDYARDVIAVADELGLEQFHMMGWAFGNRISRMAATEYPGRIKSVILIAAGGLVPALTVQGELGRLLGEPGLPQGEKIALARRTLFSPLTDASLVRDYVDTLTYWPEGRRAQQQANRNTPLEIWSAGGSAPLLMVMGEDDLTAPVENGYIMQERHGERMQLVVIPGAGHVVGLEKPAETASAIIAFIRSLE